MSKPVPSREAISPFARALCFIATSALFWALPAAPTLAAESAASRTTYVASDAAPRAVEPLLNYREWHEAPLVDWAAANRRVAEIGGWMTYLREVQAGDGSDDAGTGGHDHHGHHGH